MPGHIDWLKDTGQKLSTSDGKPVQVLEFRYQKDPKVLSAWAKHFRNHYCMDSEIDILRLGTGYSRAQYLNEIKFPDASTGLGPGLRSGDFGEILVADYLEYVLRYWVPRSRYCNKNIRNESTKGCDIIGFRVLNATQESPEDTLAVYETKAQLTGARADNKLQEAVHDSAKDITRKAESLNAIKQRLLDKKQFAALPIIARFQDPEDHPYKEISGAAALFSTANYTPAHASMTNASEHPNKDNLVLLIIHGKDMMELVHELYRRAADEA